MIDPYEATCAPDAFPFEEASRLLNLYVVSFFKRHLQAEAAYDAYLSLDYAATEPAIDLAVK